MRVGLLAPPWLPVPPVKYGGTESVIDTLARGLQAAGHRVELFTTGDSTCPVPRRWALPAAASERMGDAVTELRHVFDGYEALADCDIVHDHTIVGPMVAQAAFPHVRVVTTNHGPFDGDLGEVYARIAGRVPIIAISHAQRRSTTLPIAEVIHHGIDVESIPVGRGSGGYYAFLGRMAPEKGVHLAAQAARRIGARLLIAAKMREPREHEYFEECVRPLLGGGVEYIGEIGAEKTQLLGDAIALINPIRWPEPFGLVMVEALATGTPVVALPVGSAPEIIEHRVSGILCADVEALPQACEEAATLRREDCRAAAQRRFSASLMVERHVRLFNRLLRTRDEVRVEPVGLPPRPVPTLVEAKPKLVEAN